MQHKELPSYDKLISTLEKTISTAWHLNTIHEPGIKRWLDNFTGEALLSEIGDKEDSKELEQRIALFLLCNFIYYNENEVKHLMKLMLEKFIHLHFSKKDVKEVNEKDINDLISKSKFSQLGNESESSAYMLYLFRQVNELSKSDFEDKVFVENVIFVDDFSITGNQAEWYIRKYKEAHPNNKDVQFFVLLMISTSEAIDRIKSIPEVVDVLPCIIMDESSKAFSTNSIIFEGYNPELKKQAKKVCEYYGEEIKGLEEGTTSLGYGGCGYVIGTYYNTPNNTLPIFWSEENYWRPFFKRFNKKYTDSEVRLGGQYV